jgi:hypothetical protein
MAEQVADCFQGQTRPQELKGVRVPKAMHPLRRNVQSASPRPLLKCFGNRRRFKHTRRRYTSQKDFAKIWVIALEAASELSYSEVRTASSQVFQQRCGDFVSEGQPKQSTRLALLDTEASGPPCHILQRKCHNVAAAQAVGGDQEKNRIVPDA